MTSTEICQELKNSLRLHHERSKMIDARDRHPAYTQQFFEDCLLRGGWTPAPLEEDIYLINYQGKTSTFPIYGKFVPENHRAMTQRLLNPDRSNSWLIF